MEETAEILSDFFQSVFTSEPAGEVPTLPTVIEEATDDFEFTKEDVEEKLNKLSDDKCPGPDQIHPRVLRECSQELSLPLYIQKDARHWHPGRGLEDCEGNSYFQERFKNEAWQLQTSEFNLHPLQDHGINCQG